MDVSFAAAQASVLRGHWRLAQYSGLREQSLRLPHDVLARALLRAHDRLREARAREASVRDDAEAAQTEQIGASLAFGIDLLAKGATRGRCTPKTVCASAAPMNANCTRCSRRTSAFAPTSSSITGRPGTGSGRASAGL